MNHVYHFLVGAGGLFVIILAFRAIIAACRFVAQTLELKSNFETLKKELDEWRFYKPSNFERSGHLDEMRGRMRDYKDGLDRLRQRVYDLEVRKKGRKQP